MKKYFWALAFFFSLIYGVAYSDNKNEIEPSPADNTHSLQGAYLSTRFNVQKIRLVTGRHSEAEWMMKNGYGLHFGYSEFLRQRVQLIFNNYRIKHVSIIRREKNKNDHSFIGIGAAQISSTTQYTRRDFGFKRNGVVLLVNSEFDITPKLSWLKAEFNYNFIYARKRAETYFNKADLSLLIGPQWAHLRLGYRHTFINSNRTRGSLRASGSRRSNHYHGPQIGAGVTISF